MRKFYTAVALGGLVVAVSAASCKCNKDEDVPPPPVATAAPTPTPTMDLAVEEDAGPDAGDADADAKKLGTGTYDPSKLMACCNALAQNAKSAPPTQAPFMLQAAAACKSAAAAGNLGAVSAALRSAGMGVCR